MPNIENKEGVTIFGLIVPAIGYLFVALICIMSGSSLREELKLLEFVAITPEQFLYWLLLVPIFVNRVIMYEQGSKLSEVDIEWKRISIQLPFVLFVFCLF